MEWNVIPIDFGQGADTKTDPKQVVAGKFLRLENAVFTNPKGIQKRNGYSGLPLSIIGDANLINPKLIHEYNGELVCADSGSLYAYSPTKLGWANRGPYNSIQLSRKSIDQNVPNSGYSDCAVFGNYSLFIYESVTFKIYGLVIDNQTGSVVCGPTLLSSGSAFGTPRAVLLGNSILGVVYVNSAGTALVSRFVDFSSAISFSSEVTISTNYVSAPFDITSTATGAAIVYRSTGGLTLASINTSGAVISSVAIADANIAASGSILFHISKHSTTNDLWIYWTNATTPGLDLRLVYAVYSSALTVVLTKTTIVTIPSPFFVSNMIARTTSATEQTLYWGQYTTDRIDFSKFITASVAGVIGAASTFSYGIIPFSRPFTVNGMDYAVFSSRGTNMNPTGGTVTQGTQHTFFLIKFAFNNSIPITVSRFAYAVAASKAILKTTIGYMPQIASRAAAKFEFACAVTTQLTPQLPRTDAGDAFIDGLFSYFFEFDGADCNIAKNCGDLAILNGGLVQVYDGLNCSEFNFHLAPEIPAISHASGSGNISSGTYRYIAIFQWIDAKGNLHQSATSLAAAITVTGSNNTVTLKVTPSFLTQKSNVWVAIYRTTNNGTIYYQVSDSVNVTLANPITDLISFSDTISDAVLITNLVAYSYPGSPVLENSTPCPSMILVSRNNRLQMVDAENPNTYWYTKTFTPAVGLSPSNLLTQTIDPKLGKITALAEMDEKLVLFTSKGVFIQTGDGADDTGAGSQLSNPQPIPSDVGCDNLKSVIVCPLGTIFHSDKGIYLLARSVAISYLGMEVEQYNNQVITDARIIPSKSQLRFLCSSGLTLVYDYIFNQWSTFTNHTGLSATNWDGVYVYTTGAAILKEAPGVFTDNGTAFKMLAQTSWLRLTSIQNFQRVRRLIMLGDYANGASVAHGLNLSFAYDFGTSFTTPLTYQFGSAASSGVFQYRERFERQKEDVISILIEENTTGNNSETVSLTNISFEAMLKRGVNKLPQNRSIS